MSRCTRSSLRLAPGGLLACGFLATAAGFVSAQEDRMAVAGRSYLEGAAIEQGPKEAIEGVRDLYVRVRYKAYKDGSGGKEVEAEGWLRQFYRPQDLLRVERETPTGGEIEFVQVYNDRSRTGRYMAAGKEPKDAHDERELAKLRDHLRPLRFLFLSYFLREGCSIRYVRPAAGHDARRISWREKDMGESGETLELLVAARRLENVTIRKPGEPDVAIDLADHARFKLGDAAILLPRQALVSRMNSTGAFEPVLELRVAQDGIVFNPDLDAEVYESPASETPAKVE